jgi:hypothetical protein
MNVLLHHFEVAYEHAALPETGIILDTIQDSKNRKMKTTVQFNSIS